MRKSNKGFTLIELLVVIAIIGLLSTLAVVALNSARQKSRDSKRVADIKQIQTALELYFAEMNSYPVAAEEVTLGSTNVTALCSDGTTGGFDAACDDDETVYMGLIPSNPTPADGTCDGSGYMYQETDGASYEIDFCLGGKAGDLEPDSATATPNGISQP
jgi:prepilin-type N-terminal cleavage/methylation domain-containing protein